MLLHQKSPNWCFFAKKRQISQEIAKLAVFCQKLPKFHWKSPKLVLYRQKSPDFTRYRQKFCASPSNNFISLSYLLSIFSANLFGLFWLRTCLHFRWTLVVIYASVITMGIIGNVVILYAILSKQRMRTARNYFILCLGKKDALKK